MSENIDEKIRDAVLSTLHKAYRNPRGKYLHVTFPIVHREVQDIVQCNREDTKRELTYLMKKKLVDEKKKHYNSYKIGNTKFPGGDTIYYELSSHGIDLFESSEKYASMPYMLMRHTIRILKASSNFDSASDLRGDFQPKICFLPIDANVEEGDKLQLIENENVLDEKIVGEVNKHFGGSLSHIEVLWKKAEQVTSGSLHISNSHVYAPVTVGNSNTVQSLTFVGATDTEKILQLIDDKKDIPVNIREQLKGLMQQELPALLENPDVNSSKTLLEKVKGFGQTWLVPVITQVVATYFQHQMGINS